VVLPTHKKTDWQTRAQYFVASLKNNSQNIILKQLEENKK
jgi:hypothetical protein